MINDIAKWLGEFLSTLPTWLFWPAFAVIMIVAAILCFLGTAVYFPSQNKRAYLGERKNDKK